ncbi:porin family protein [Shewanella avicenniae]|uniref:Porin family protein n=1 Tax=Shewanella avicenniae TaxID=2814294 RepID=A0ABX7QQQ0_9GAMM|nr:outer membrane beta-barrel protein [Shewanella avicenniae]QSX33035.1 porin family protein [Shewanella avicenniae]
MIQRIGLLVAAAMTVCLSAQASAATIFVAPFAGYSIGSAGLGTNTSNDGFGYRPNDRGGSLDDSGHWGVKLGYARDDYTEYYLLYSHQRSTLQQYADGINYPIVDLSVQYLHLGGTHYLTSGPLQPYLDGSLGVIHFSPNVSDDINDRFSIAIAGGARYLFSSHFSVFAELRGLATFFANDDSVSCQRDRNCVWSVDKSFWQGQANLGLQLRF